MIKMDTNGIRIGTKLMASYFYRYKNVSSVVKIGTGVMVDSIHASITVPYMYAC